MITEFVGDDAAYLDWLAGHPSGFVLNIRSWCDPSYMVLHRATCRTISVTVDGAAFGGFTERAYRKICADTIDELHGWTKSHGRPDGSFSKRCKLCRPE